MPVSQRTGAALQPFRGTRPLLHGVRDPCRSGLVPRKGRKATPAILKPKIAKGMAATLYPKPPIDPTDDYYQAARLSSCKIHPL